MKYAITIIAILAFTSCKKEYTCQCVDKDGHEVSRNTYKFSNKDESQYKTLCDGQAVGFSVDYPDKVPITCSLD